jgi:hypothetical protein
VHTVHIGGRSYRSVSLDSDPLADEDTHERELDRMMRQRPTPPDLMRNMVVTRNGNVVPAVSR